MGFGELREVELSLEEFLMVVLEILEPEVNVVILVQQEILDLEVVKGHILDFGVRGDGNIELAIWLIHDFL